MTTEQTQKVAALIQAAKDIRREYNPDYSRSLWTADASLRKSIAEAEAVLRENEANLKHERQHNELDFG